MICSNKLKFILFGLLFIESKIDAQEMPETSIPNNTTTRDVMTSSSTTTSTTSATTSVNYMAQINAHIKKNNDFPISGKITIPNNSNTIRVNNNKKPDENMLKSIKSYLETIVAPKKVDISVIQRGNFITLQIQNFH